ncbi:uncharacterized protein LOC128232832 isoform X4 [Mya arenaria]|uniref:uncharacterized protein LOC128232832 isoform X4 n=1 Tax=Mya arenaria TaxID=6604 RepID=UPI0022DE980E|nr:uncharacterized protein LOC128232832 isoform X4 [Mya arenaria]
MSFKRDGDDYCALSVQRKNRVTELLYEDTSSEEVSKLQNGKYVCKLCHHKPIFDTLNMFHVHKQAKKHLESIKWAELEKQELADLIQKRKHENEPNTQQVKEETHSFGSKKPRTRPHQRKRAIDLDLPCIDTTPVSSLPGNHVSGVHGNKYFKGSAGCGFSANKKTMSSDLRGNVESTHTSLSTYHHGNQKNSVHNSKTMNRHSGTIAHNSEADVTHKNISSVVGGISNISQFYAARRKQKQASMNEINSQLKGPMSSFSAEKPKSIYKSWDYYKQGKPGRSISIPHTGCKKLITDKPNSHPCGNREADVERAANAEKILKAFGSGWKKDWTGKWVKDEEAEFDSDDEPPNV